MIRLYDTLSRETVELVPRESGKVSIYVCGPTVYEVPHVGHGRAALVFDIISRYLEWRGFDVTFVTNITDVEDKIIARAAEEGSTEPDVAQRYEAAYWAEMDRLGVRHPDALPRATAYIDRMVKLIAELVDSGRAYVIGRRPHRRRRAEAQSRRLRAVEGGEAGRAGVGFAVGEGAPGLAHRVLDDVARPAGRRLRYPRRR
jgi:cysteinyl-tRNA synthetase